MESVYERDPETTPVSIHPYGKHHTHDARSRPTADPAEEARFGPASDVSVRYADFFDRRPTLGVAVDLDAESEADLDVPVSLDSGLSGDGATEQRGSRTGRGRTGPRG